MSLFFRRVAKTLQTKPYKIIISNHTNITIAEDNTPKLAFLQERVTKSTSRNEGNNAKADN